MPSGDRGQERERDRFVKPVRRGTTRVTTVVGACMKPTIRTPITLAVSLLLAASVAACGDDGDTTSTSGDDPGGRGDGAELVVQIVEGGGFVTPTMANSTVPQVTVLADGTVLTPGIITLVYPGPAVSPIQQATVDPAEVDALVEKARELGLLDGPLDFGQPAVSDAPTTTVTIVADGETHTQEAYALTFEDGQLTPEQLDNRAALSEFIAAAQSTGVGDATWTPSSYVVTVVGPAEAGDPPQEPQEWPIESTPPTDVSFGCTVVDGDEATELAAALESANAATPWLIDGFEYGVAIRPQLPGDPGCA
jgi:hypothetical protein